MKTETSYNKIVNIAEDGEITVLDYTFIYGDGMKGATGTKFYPVSQEEYKERTSKQNVIDAIIEVGVPSEFARTGANGCYLAMKQNNEIRDFMFDCSYEKMWDYLRKELKLTKKQAFIFNCVGGGRCFDKYFQGNVNTELSEIIREFEK